MTLAEHEALAAALEELAEVAAQWAALARWEREQRACLPRPGLIGGRGPRQARTLTIPLPASQTDWRVTIPGIPTPRTSVQTDEQPFPLCRVRHLPPPPSRPDLSPLDDPNSAFNRALSRAFGKPLKSRR